MTVYADGYVRHKAYIDVLGAELWLAEDADARLFFPVKASCGYLGIDYNTSLDTIKADGRLAPGLRQIKLPTAGGPQVQQCLRKLEYTWWLSLLDPRRFHEERRALIADRQRTLMEFAEDAILGAGQLQRLAPRRDGNGRSAVEVSGEGVEARMRCQRCGAPHLIVVDGAGWHVHVAVDVE